MFLLIVLIVRCFGVGVVKYTSTIFESKFCTNIFKLECWYLQINGNAQLSVILLALANIETIKRVLIDFSIPRTTSTRC